MKVGARDRPPVVAGCVLTVLAGFLLGHWILAWKSSASADTASSASGISAGRLPTGKIGAKTFDPLDPSLHFSRLALTEHEVYAGSGRNIFESYREDREEKGVPRPRPTPLPLPTPATAATIGLKFFGIAMISGLPRLACLSQEGDIFIGGEGQIVDRRYKLLRMGTDRVEVQDLLGNHKYTLPLQR
jgi:hypothetical protein